MTAALEWSTAVATDTVRDMPRSSDDKPFTARVRLTVNTWDRFEVNVGERNRSSWVKDFIDALNREPQLWKDAHRIADARGELLWTVVAAALSRYVARHKHLLDDADPE